MKLTNHFLIAMPTLTESPFTRSVTYICDHNADGAIGFIINKPSRLFFSDVFKQMEIDIQTPHLAKEKVFSGGPLQHEKGFVIHVSHENHWKSSLLIGSDLRITTSKDVLEDLAHNELSTQHILLLGYASWEAGQLEKEIIENLWLVAPANRQIMFETPVETRWTAATKLLGFHPAYLSGDLGHA